MIFLWLMFFSLIPLNSGGTFVEQITQLLNSHTTDMDLAKVMELLPGEWSLDIVGNFLMRAIRSNYHECLEGQVVKNLRKSENLQVRAEMVTLQNPSTVIMDRT